MQYAMLRYRSSRIPLTLHDRDNPLGFFCIRSIILCRLSLSLQLQNSIFKYWYTSPAIKMGIKSIARTRLPSFLAKSRSCMKPLNGAKPVPGPTIIIGVLGRVGKRNWDFLTKIGTRQGGSEGCFSFNQLVVTPLFILPVGVLYSTTTAVIWTEVGWS